MRLLLNVHFFLWNFNGISNQPATQDSAWQKGASVRLGRTPREDFPSASRRLAQISSKNVARKTRTAFARGLQLWVGQAVAFGMCDTFHFNCPSSARFGPE